MLKNFDEVLEKVRSIEPFTVSVAAAADKELLQAVKTAADLGFVRPVLVGDPKAIGDICTVDWIFGSTISLAVSAATLGVSSPMDLVARRIFFKISFFNGYIKRGIK